ncbi:MAG: helix-turn-helix domain-containing protein [Defluviitaleaceae bacterium]|nr:helix-turn-helix domain-containing protein [Defluviitaleaceae bacterium]
MKSPSKLTLGQKLKMIRDIKGFTQGFVAQKIKRNTMYVSRLESGQADCSNTMLVEIKKAMQIENAPLLEHELIVYRNRLIVCNDLLNAGRTYDAREAYINLFPLYILSYEQDLAFLHSMTEVRLLFQENNFLAGEERLIAAEAYLDKIGNDGFHLYHYNKAKLYIYNCDNKNALRHLLKAHAIKSDDFRNEIQLLLDIGICYCDMGRPLLAIVYLERVSILTRDERCSSFQAYINLALAASYFSINELTRAKNLYENAILYMRAINDTKMLCDSLGNLGMLYCFMGNPEDGLALCNEALIYYNDLHLEQQLLYERLLISRAWCLLKLKAHLQCKDVLMEGRDLTGGKLGIMFDALGHLMTLDEISSTDYIETVAIPFFGKSDFVNRYYAIHFCDILESHYVKRKSLKKAKIIASISRDIYKEMLRVSDDTIAEQTFSASLVTRKKKPFIQTSKQDEAV